MDTLVAGGMALYASLLWIACRARRRHERRLEAQSAQLRHRNTTLEFFTQSLSHDLRNATLAIRGLAGRLREEHGVALDDDGLDLLRRLDVNAERQDHLIEDLLTVSRIGASPPPLRKIELCILVREVVAETLTVLDSGPVKVTVQDSLGVLVARVDDVRTIFQQLVSNAVTFMSDQPAPAIEIGAEDRGDEVLLFVRDNGRGIHPDAHARIFRLFERLDVTEGQGTGVGLTIVKRIVESAGGRVWVESAPGHGATFRFIVPRVWPVPHVATA